MDLQHIATMHLKQNENKEQKTLIQYSRETPPIVHIAGLGEYYSICKRSRIKALEEAVSISHKLPVMLLI